jgi:TolB-like protein/class 3 adenylate cyclase/Flp pilus assembly protein TadD
MERRLAAILAADVVGYSRLMGEDEEETAQRLSAYRKVIDELIAGHDGRVFGSAGDSVIAEFASPVQAVRCAVEIQRSLKERNADLPEDRRMRFRIGVNLGDIMVEGDNLLGDGVNVAARLEGLAEPGGICVRRAVRNQVRDKLPVVFEDMGEVEVKNIARPVRAFRVLTEPGTISKTARRLRTTRLLKRGAAVAVVVLILTGAGVLAWLQPWQSNSARLTPSLSSKTSIAVLPFSNLSRDPEQEYFSDGITNDLITDLSKFHDLFVIASNSVFTYKGKAVKIQEVGRELGVKYILEGSVQKLDDRVRINSQLIDAASGNHLWAERYDEAATNLFDLQEKITKEIVRTLSVRLSDIEQDRAFKKETNDLEAYDYVLRGWELVSRLKRAENFEARQMFRKAVARDPDYAAAYAGLGYSHLYSFEYGWSGSPEAELKRAEDLARRSIALEDNNVHGHRLLGYIYLYLRQYDLANIEIERAIALNPNDASNHVTQGVVQVWSGHPEGAVLALETALRYDPKMNSDGLSTLGLAYYLIARYEDAIRILERCVRQNPDFQYGHVVLAATYGSFFYDQGLREPVSRSG